MWFHIVTFFDSHSNISCIMNQFAQLFVFSFSPLFSSCSVVAVQLFSLNLLRIGSTLLLMILYRVRIMNYCYGCEHILQLKPEKLTEKRVLTSVYRKEHNYKSCYAKRGIWTEQKEIQRTRLVLCYYCRIKTFVQYVSKFIFVVVVRKSTER